MSIINKARNYLKVKEYEKKKKKHDSLKNKLLNGSISQKELTKYNNLKEEVEKMSKKFVYENGKLSLKENENKEVKPEQEQRVEQSKSYNEEMMEQVNQQTDKEDLQEENYKEEIDRQEEEDKLRQAKENQQRQQQEEERVRQEQERLKQKQEDEEMKRQYQQELQQKQYEQQQDQQRLQEKERQERMSQEQEQRQQYEEIEECSLKLYIKDMPEIPIIIDKRNIMETSQKINYAIESKTVLKIGDLYINGDKILMYLFEEKQKEEEFKRS